MHRVDSSFEFMDDSGFPSFKSTFDDGSIVGRDVGSGRDKNFCGLELKQSRSCPCFDAVTSLVAASLHLIWGCGGSLLAAWVKIIF